MLLSGPLRPLDLVFTSAIGWTSWLQSKTPVVGMPENLPLSRLAPEGGEELELESATTELGMMATAAATKL